MNPLTHLRPCLQALATFTLVSGISASRATVLDDFNGPSRTGWEDANPANLPLPGGQQDGGQFTFSLPTPGRPYFVASRKTSETFELKEGRTVEFRVDLVHGQGPDSFAVLAFIPQTTGPNSLGGYGLSKSETDILISKGINNYFFNENPTPAVKNDNVTLVLNLAVRDGSVHITGQVLDKDDGDRVIWEKNYVDTPAADVLSDGEDDPPEPFVNLPGNFVLYLYADGGTDPSGYEVVYDNAETFVCDRVVVDDFNATQRSDWEDSNPGNLPLPGGQQGDGVFSFSLPPPGRPYFVASRKTLPTYELTEGSRHEFSVDMVSGQGPDSFVVLAWIPIGTGPNTLAGYGLAKSETDVLVTKGINQYFYNEDPTPALKNENVRLTLTLTVRQGNVIIRARIFDREDADRVLFDRTFVDTPASEVLSDGEDDPREPYITTGNVVLYLYADGGNDPSGYQVVCDNLEVCAPPSAGNPVPVISEINPSAGANFLPTSTPFTFKVTDDQPIPDDGISVQLNGTHYTTANGLTLGPAGAVRTATLSGFAADTDYSGEIRVTDAGGAGQSAPVFFDTFDPSYRTVEIEDYNFESGGYFNAPVRTPEGGGGADNSYVDRVGTPLVDFDDTRTTPNGEDSLYRTLDPVRVAHTLDRRRAAFDPDAGVYDEDVGDLAEGEWLNFTRDFADATYDVYLREATINLTRADSVLEKVTSDPTQENQTVEPIGSFLGATSGFTFRNVSLTDGVGQAKVRVRLSGKTTLRLRTVTADTDGGNRYLNYLLFVPVTDAGVQRAAIATLSPAPDATLNSISPTVTVSIQNRETSVKPDTVKLTIGGAEVSGATVTPTATGATLSYTLSPLPPPGSEVAASISFRDSDDEPIQAQWSFTLTYPYIGPELRIAATGTQDGFNLHVVQAPVESSPLDNSLDRAENQLAANSPIARFVDTNAVVDVINFDKRPGEAAGHIEGDSTVPGIDPDTTGNGDNDFAVEILTYLELSAGAHRFGISTDDGYKLSTGRPPIGPSTPPLAFHNGGPGDDTFDFIVAEAGVYAFRMVWYERGGAGYAEWFSVNPTGGERTLINDPAAAEAVRAWRAIEEAPAEVIVESSATVTGPFTAEAGAVINSSTSTATVAATAGGTRFYRLRAGTALRLKTIAVQGSEVTLTWQ